MSDASSWRAHAALVLAGLVTLGGGLRLAAQDATRTLGGGLAVVRCSPRPTVLEPPQCWSPVGFTFGAYGTLRYARAFERTTTGRILAAIPSNVSQLGTGRMAPVVFTDDLGAHWSEAVWSPPTGPGGAGAFAPLALSSDPLATSDARRRVVAAGEYARIWVSADGGASFTERHAGGQTFTSVDVLGRAIVLVDVDGRVWASHDDAFSLDLIDGERGSVVTRTSDAIEVVRGRSRLRFDAHGTLHRGSR